MPRVAVGVIWWPSARCTSLRRRAVTAVLVAGLAVGFGVAREQSAGAAAGPRFGQVALIHVGYGPEGVAIDPSTHDVYVAAGGVAVIDESGDADNGHVTANISTGVGSYTWAVAVDPSTNTVYTANIGNNTVSVITGSAAAHDQKVTATIPVGAQPAALAVDPSTHNVYVTNYGNNPSADGTVSVIDESGDARNGKVVATITVGNYPTAVAVDPSTHDVYVTNDNDGTVSVIDESGDAHNGTVIATVPIGGNSGPRGVAIDPSTHRVYTANSGNNTVSVIDGSAGADFGTVTATIPEGVGGDYAGAVAVDTATHNVYVLNESGESPSPFNSFNGFGTMSVIDESGDASTGAVTTVGPVGALPDAMAFDPSDHDAYVTNLETNTMSVINTTPADLAMTLTGPTSAAGRSTFDETVTLTNHGPGTAADVTTELLIPAGLHAADAATAATNPVIWTDASIPSGTTVTHTITLQVTASIPATTAIGGVTASSDDYDPNPANNTAISSVHLG